MRLCLISQNGIETGFETRGRVGEGQEKAGSDTVALPAFSYVVVEYGGASKEM